MSADGHGRPLTNFDRGAESAGTLGSNEGTVILDAASAGRITIPLDALLLTAQYARDGDDLVLTGGAGADSFQYLAPEDGTAWTSEANASAIVADSLADFVSGSDAIVLDAAGFEFEVGTLNGEPDAGDTDFSVIVDGNGALIYDANGSDPGYTVLASSGAGSVVDTDVQVKQLT